MIKFGRGTVWRVGVADSVTVTTGEHVTVSPAGGAAAAAAGQGTTGGEASLSITTSGTTNALEKMDEGFIQVREAVQFSHRLSNEPSQDTYFREELWG